MGRRELGKRLSGSYKSGVISHQSFSNLAKGMGELPFSNLLNTLILKLEMSFTSCTFLILWICPFI